MLRFLLVSAALFACTPTVHNTTAQLAAQGKVWEASQMYLDMLNTNPEDWRAKVGLKETAPQAFSDRLELAREYDADGQVLDSMATFDEAMAFAEVVSSHQISIPVEAARAEKAIVVSRQADRLLNNAKGAAAGGQYEQAEQSILKAQELAPSNPSLKKTRAEVYTSWANADMASGKYLEAREHFLLSYEATGDPLADRWAAALERAVGRHALENNYCRTAYDLLERAIRMPDQQLPLDLAKAEHCARFGVIVEPFSSNVNAQEGQTDIAAMMTDRMEVGLAEKGSKHLRLVAKDFKGPAALPTAYHITGRVTQLIVDTAPVEISKVKVSGELGEGCDPTQPPWDEDAVCPEVATVVVTLQTIRKVARIEGSIQIINAITGEKQTVPLTSSTEFSKMEIQTVNLLEESEPQEEEGEEVELAVGAEVELVTEETKDAFVPDDWEWAAALQTGAIPTDTELLSQAINTFAAQAINKTLAEVDQTDNYIAPRSLVIERPN